MWINWTLIHTHTIWKPHTLNPVHNRNLKNLEKNTKIKIEWTYKINITSYDNMSNDTHITYRQTHTNTNTRPTYFRNYNIREYTLNATAKLKLYGAGQGWARLDFYETPTFNTNWIDRQTTNRTRIFGAAKAICDHILTMSKRTNKAFAVPNIIL